MITGLLVLLVAATLPGCTGPADEAEPGTCLGPDDTLDWASVPIPGLREQVTGLGTARASWRSSGSDTLYFQDEVRSQIRLIRPTWIQPEGEFCLASSSPAEDCVDGAFYSAGLIEVSAGRGVCLDDEADRLYVAQGDGFKVTMVGTTRRGETWSTYHRAIDEWVPERAEGESLGDACAARAGRVALTGSEQVVIYDASGALEQRIPFGPTVDQLAWLGEGDQLIARTIEGEVWVIDTTLARSWLVAAADAVQAMAVDEARGVAWLLDAQGRVKRLEVGIEGLLAARTLTLCGTARDLEVDLESGALHVLIEEEDGGSAIWVLDEDEVRARIELEEQALALLPPGRTAQAAVLVAGEADAEGNETQETRAFWVYDPAVERPPLSMFVVTTLEQPFTNPDMACTPAENPVTNFSDYVAQLRANIPIAAALDLPIAVGITWEFLVKAQECGLDGVIEELDAAGFDLGTMIHAMPCYSCTDQVVPGEAPEVCNELDESYQTADSEEACWPSNPDYCSRGDQSCWFDWVGAKVMDVDRAIPGGSRFIFGADRHRINGFEYIADGYRTFPRADGGVGYDITFFQGSWIYPEIDSIDDPRGKDSAPAEPALLGRTWFLADVDSWEQDSAFSDLLYMPGSTVALKRLYDMELADLSQGHITDEISPMQLTTEDVRTVEAWLARAITRRDQRPGSFYFHLPDLSGYAMQGTKEADRLSHEQALLELKASIDQRWGAGGLGWVEWRGPVELRERVETSAD